MTSKGQKFPPQSQDTQLGKQYLMNPLPKSVNAQYKPSKKLYGKVALVTGGDSGIGRAVCYYFALEGATVAFTYDKVVSQFGRIDVLVNNAGVAYYNESIDEITEEQLRMTFEINFFASFFLAKHSIKHMKEGSSIISTASVTAYTGAETIVDYSSSKGALVSFTRSLSLQLIDQGIRVNAVAPGPIWTPLQVAVLPAEKVVDIGRAVPMDRAAEPFEVAPSYVFLASNECSSYFTGQVLHPNGGDIVNG